MVDALARGDIDAFSAREPTPTVAVEHAGAIEVHSELGARTSFTIWLPRWEEPASVHH